MFISYISKYLGYDQKTDQYQYEITIIDSEFEETVTTTTTAMAPAPRDAAARTGALPAAALKIYSARNLNVSKNLFLLFQYVEKQYNWWTTKKQYEWCLEYVPEYTQYHEGVKKLLLFS